jgi:predicted phosphodiesterase
MNLITLKPEGKFVFVGDTHGDLNASQKVINTYLEERHKIVFLGDYVDRGPQSKQNIDFLLDIQRINPEKVYLLKGNHETYHIMPFQPADFWHSLSFEKVKEYIQVFDKLPLAICIGDIIALHGALPDINKLEDIEKISSLGRDSNWESIIWGDFNPENINGKDYSTGRPYFGQAYFEKIMSQINKKILIRSHQPNAPECIFENKCLTIFTSCAYGRERTIAIADFDKNEKIETIDDLVIKKI